MKNYTSLYKIFIPLFCLFVLGCANDKKPEGIKKVNAKGLPIMVPFQKEFPKLKATYVCEKKNQVERFFKKTWSENNDNVSFLVAQNGQIVYENYFGYANKTIGEKITAYTLLHIASVSKVLTATAVLMLIDADKVKLDQKVTEFIPNFPYTDITVQTLLNHRSGMRSYPYFTYENNNWDKKKTLTNADIVKVMTDKNIQLESKTDTRFAYCNTNYAMLALIIEKVTGMSYPQAMKEMIFDPLGMKHTYVYEIEKHRESSSRTYKGNMELAVEYLDGVYGDKNIYSTPQDLLKFDAARYSPYFLNRKLLKKVYKGYSYEAKGQRNYGLGIRMIEFEKGEPFFYHNGWWHGNTSCFITLRKEKVTMIVLSNKYTKKTYQTKKLASLFGDYPFGKEEIGAE